MLAMMLDIEVQEFDEYTHKNKFAFIMDDAYDTPRVNGTPVYAVIRLGDEYIPWFDPVDFWSDGGDMPEDVLTQILAMVFRMAIKAMQE